MNKTKSLMNKLSILIGALASALILAVPSAAQRPWDGRKLSYGMEPEQDSLAFLEIRHRMDSIREKRPTVALVLSGGGAKGAAHVGVIRYLEKIGMPVDLVVGTSMGGLVGGIYALGYNADQMEHILKTIDWESALSDKVPRSYISYAQAKYKEKFFFALPFYYKKDDYLHFKSTYDKRFDEELKLSADEGNSVQNYIFKDNLLGSLPSGFVFGQNVNNIISSITIGYQDETDFFKLPIPFVCVASDMVTSKAKVWTSGRLVTALRSTMSIPGLFAPVRIDGMVLVDGGMVDNYPTDLARKMGADYVIGVDLSSGYLNYEEINNLADVLMTGVDMLGRSSYENNVKLADVSAAPDLKGYNMLSFGKEQIDTILSRGWQCALDIGEKIKAIKAKVGPDTLTLQSDRGFELASTPILIDRIEIRGVSDQESRYLMKLLKDIRPGRRVSRKDVEDATATIFGTNAFDYVNFKMEGTKEPFSLIFDCKKGPVNQLGIGGRIDTEEVGSLLVNLGINTRSLSGSSLNLIGKVSVNPSISAKYRFKLKSGHTFNLSNMGRWVNQDQISIGESNFKIGYFNYRADLYLSNIKWSNFQLQTGIRYDYYHMKSVMMEGDGGDYARAGKHNGYGILFADSQAGNFDDGYFPTKGYIFEANYQYGFAGVQESVNPFHIASVNFQTVVPVGGVFALIPAFNGRAIFGDNIPVNYANLIGGDISGRYMDQQLAFMGINNACMVNNILLMGRLDLRFKLLKNNYLTAVVNGGDSYNDWKDIVKKNESEGIFGFGLEYAYDTIIGPLKADIHWSSKSHHLGAYLSLGFKF